MKCTHRSFAASALAFLLSPSVWAFTFSPITASLEPSGSRATQSFHLENDTQAPAAVEISVATREIDAEGKETNDRSPAVRKQFLIYPPQLLLKPGEKRTVRVSWVGNPKPPGELAFRVIAEQLPVQTQKKKRDQGKGTINMLLKYMAAVYISPPDAKPEVVVKDAAPAENDLLAITIENKGTAHQILKDPSIKVTSNTDPAVSVEIPKEQLKQVNGQNLLAKAERKFTVPWPPNLPKGPVKVDLAIQD